MAKKSRAGGQVEGAEALYRALDELLASISAGDVLDSEMQVSSLIALALMGGTEAEQSVLAAAFIDAAEARADEPETMAAFLRLLMALGPRPVKRQASEALADITGEGIYPPEWVTGIGKPVPGRAYRGRDLFCDREAVLVTFSYADAEHALLVLLDLSELPTASSVSLTTDVPRMMKLFEDDDDKFFERLEPVALSEARRRIEVPLARAGRDPGIERDSDDTPRLALRRVPRRVRRPGQCHGAHVCARYRQAGRGCRLAGRLPGPAGARRAAAGEPRSR